MNETSHVTNLIWDPAEWQKYLDALPALKACGLAGDDLWRAIEQTWAPLFEGVGEEQGATIEEWAMAALVRAGILSEEESHPV